MNRESLPSDPYKGVRDFYPDKAAIQEYIFNTWSKTAESFGYQLYNASILEPAQLYKAKGAENEELVNEQTYTFTDRGDREVTLRPEMTPTVARMIAKKQRELGFPIRWYSIPNLFRYERPQRGRLREHWQLNCDIFGSEDLAADIEVITLAYQTLIDFGAKAESFVIHINDRSRMNDLYASLDLKEEAISKITKLNDQKNKISKDEYMDKLINILDSKDKAAEVMAVFSKDGDTLPIVDKLKEIGIQNVIYDKFLARGFDYYTGTIFEIFDTSGENNRSLLGGGRYDNLTAMFGTEPVAGVGFGMGDVTVENFLETHNLLPEDLGKTLDLVVIPKDENYSLEAQKAARFLRNEYASVLVDISTKKLAKKIAEADAKGAKFIAVIGEDEVKNGSLTIKDLASGQEKSASY